MATMIGEWELENMSSWTSDDGRLHVYRVRVREDSEQWYVRACDPAGERALAVAGFPPLGTPLDVGMREASRAGAEAIGSSGRMVRDRSFYRILGLERDVHLERDARGWYVWMHVGDLTAVDQYARAGSQMAGRRFPNRRVALEHLSFELERAGIR